MVRGADSGQHLKMDQIWNQSHRIVTRSQKWAAFKVRTPACPEGGISDKKMPNNVWQLKEMAILESGQNQKTSFRFSEERRGGAGGSTEDAASHQLTIYSNDEAMYIEQLPCC